ncbi:MAG: hypothetical protein ACREO2_10310, partial [Arenimonas sp.]
MKLVREQGRWRLGLGLRGQMLGMLGLMMILVVLIFSAVWMNEKTNHGKMLGLTETAMRGIDQENLKRKGEALVASSTFDIANATRDKNSKILREKLQAIKKQHDVVYAIVFDREGTIIADADEGSSNGKPMLDPLANAATAAVAENKTISQW